MKKFSIGLLMLFVFIACHSQVYNNEWIDYSKTYYKFKVGVNGIYQINQSLLNSYGLGSVNAQDFQLIRDGKEVPIFTSADTGPLGTGGYIQFYGTINDGSADKILYKEDYMQMSSSRSLLTDSSAYFLVVRPGTANLRLTRLHNDLSSVGSPEPYFDYTLERNFASALYRGYSLNLGEPIYSSSYDNGEGWAGDLVIAGTPFKETLSNLYISPSATTVRLDATVVGYGLNTRLFSLSINNSLASTGNLVSYGIQRLSQSLNKSVFAGDTSKIQLDNNGTANADYILFPQYSLTYQRSFNFGGSSLFNFELKPSSGGRYLEIAGFNNGILPPILYDLNNNFSLLGNVSGGIVRFNLPPSTRTYKLVLANAEASSIRNINSFTPRNFVNYGLAPNQGDYVIISHPLLFSGVNNVQKYKNYRNSPGGGSYNSIIVESDQLVDQFAFGIRHHPLSVRNFASFALDNFAVQPKFFFLLGKGLTYQEFRTNEFSSNTDNLALVPTFGDPASDNLLTATRTTTLARIPVGRLSAITGDEVGYYLTKVKQYESAQQSTVHTVAEQAWTKNAAHLTGAIDEPYLSSYIESFMDSYDNSIKDSLYGANLYRFSKNLGQNTAIGTNKTIDTVFREGLSLLTYFGHSSANNLEFNLDDPSNYQNTGKYPVILINGCNTGNLFHYETLRAVNGGTLSEKYIFAQNKGSVAFIASTHFGLLSPLHTFSAAFYKNLSLYHYGEPLGNIMRASMENILQDYPNDFTIRIHAEEINLHGDPALRMNTHTKPDLIINDSLVTINPGFISLADERYTVTAKILNIGKAGRDSVSVRITLQSPSGNITTLSTRRIASPFYETTLTETININPLKDVGINRVIITLDLNNEIDELDETNNAVIKQFIINEDDIRPVYPYNFSIVNDPNVKLYGSTANPLHDKRPYVMEMDTTALFNSPLKISRTVTDSGGVIAFLPGITLTDSTVYYWRVALGPASGSTRWVSRSFRYINGGTPGFNQSHFYQFKDDEFKGISQDATSRVFNYNNLSHKLLIRTGLYPYYDYDQINISVDDNQIEKYGCKYNSLQFLVYDPKTMHSWQNQNANGSGSYGSWTVCSAPRKFFEFPYTTQAYRKKAMDFIDSIPAGYYFSITNLGSNFNSTFINDWKSDTTAYGSGKSLYHKLKGLGFGSIDSFYHNIPFMFIAKKEDNATFPPLSYTAGENEQIVKTVFCPGKEVTGSITTPALGPAKAWKKFKWLDKVVDNPVSDIQEFDLYGITPQQNEVYLAGLDSTREVDISFINAAQYPFIKIRSRTTDAIFATPAQIRHMMLTADMVPEGGVSPNITFQFPGGVIQDSIIFTTAFKNVSNIAFDSLRVHLVLSDEDGYSTTFAPVNARNFKLAPLAANDSVILHFRIPSIYGRNNTIRLDVNPANDQPEFTHFNNVLSKDIVTAVVRYFFIGNGNWSDPANWKYSTLPPSTLPAGKEIIIDPAAGKCVLDVSQTISQGAKITLKAGKNLVIPGNLVFQ